MTSSEFNRRIVIIEILLILFIGFRLYQMADATDNFRGMMYSLLHCIIVAIGVYFSIRKSPTV